MKEYATLYRAPEFRQWMLFNLITEAHLSWGCYRCNEDSVGVFYSMQRGQLVFHDISSRCTG